MFQWNAEGSIDSESGWRVISATYTTIFKRLPKGINTWDGLEELNNGYEPKVTMKSNDPIYAWFQNGTTDTVYIHGIKAITQEEATGITHAHIRAEDNQAVYTIDGRQIGGGFDKVGKGLYIVTEQGKTRKVVK